MLFYKDKETGERRPMHDSSLPRGSIERPDELDSTQDLWDSSAQIRSEEQVVARLPILNPQALLDRGDFYLPRQVLADYGGST